MANGVDKKDVFISYRRKDGATVARMLYEILENRGVSAFFDRESLESGDFSAALERNLAAAENVVVVVSREMFSCGLLADGTYDPAEVERDWVYREIRIALEQGKNIIPVFVNGVDGFPQLPAAIAGLALANALKFGHEHFEGELQKLISDLKTPKHQLLEAFLKVQKDGYGEEEKLNSLIDMCRRLHVADDAVEVLKKLIRSKWDAEGNEKAIDILIGAGDVADLKNLCEGLLLDNTGGVKRMKKNLLRWCSNKPSRAYDKDQSDNDRVNELVASIADVNRSVEDRQAIVWHARERWKIDFSGEKRSADDVVGCIFDKIDVEEFFKNFSSHTCLSKENVEIICEELLGQSRGSKRALLDRLVAYVNYEEAEVADE